MIRSRSLLAAALLAVTVVGASCAHSDAPATSTGSGAPAGSGGGGDGGNEPGAGPGGLGVGGFEVTSSGAGGDPSGGPGTGGAPGVTTGGGAGGAGGEGVGGEGGGVLASFDPTGTELVSGGVSMASPGYRAVLSVGQPAPVQNVMTSPGYRFEGGLLGVNGSLP